MINNENYTLTSKIKDMVNWNIMTGKAIRKNILSYITRNHPGSWVDSIEEKYHAYKINLMNGLSIIFDADGRHIKTNS
ncbi:PepSY-like domain-containing protein [Chryseobacterium sp. G0201]|uniref:PepSY-like domain-containing protein n=1 Tax=Chryseobacterium sp. G0201 TaxID=2487065 RepID=UPI000F4DE577|nr:PepSY-like domain-containing protein [Chryseobacterium sp. G0201]AZA52445.1 hypothetical protein EG348_05250 [Chryseobacterium sp. G0201]